MSAKSYSDTLKDLLQVLEDGYEGFRNAAEGVTDPELKGLFSKYSGQRAQMAEELLRFSPGKREEKKPTIAGALHRGWIDLKAALTSGDDHAILAECERGEDHAVEVYKEALAQDLPSDVSAAVGSQYAQVLEAHDKVRELRDATKASA